MSPPPIDSLAIWNATIDVTGLAAMPEQVLVEIPGENGDIAAVVHRERMDRREGFGPRDPWACEQGDPSGCEIVPTPGYPAELFSYTWIGRGEGYDLRLTIHHGHAAGVFSGSGARFGIEHGYLKELRVAYFLTNDRFVYDAPVAPARRATLASSTTEWNPAAIQEATVARIEPSTEQATRGTGTTSLDMMVLFTENARIQAGGSPTDCHDTDGIKTYIHQNMQSMDTAFQRSQIPAQIGVATVTKLNGYTAIPYGGAGTIYQNRSNIQLNANIKAFRNAVGADVVSTLFDTQAHLGVCGVAYIQRPDCGGNAVGCSDGPQFADWTYLLETVQCAIMDTFTHELGHVLGAEHDPANTSATPGTASFPYSFGYGYPPVVDGFETVMSQQFSASFPTRLLQFSNPNVYYQGRTTGNAASADNAHTLRNLAPFTAAFRSRPNLIFANGFDVNNPCPGINF